MHPSLSLFLLAYSFYLYFLSALSPFPLLPDTVHTFALPLFTLAPPSLHPHTPPSRNTYAHSFRALTEVDSGLTSRRSNYRIFIRAHLPGVEARSRSCTVEADTFAPRPTGYLIGVFSRSILMAGEDMARGKNYRATGRLRRSSAGARYTRIPEHICIKKRFIPFHFLIPRNTRHFSACFQFSFACGSHQYLRKTFCSGI